LSIDAISESNCNSPNRSVEWNRSDVDSSMSSVDRQGEPEGVDREFGIPMLPRFRVSQVPNTLSPLRYPGSKRKILSSLIQLMEANQPFPSVFVEPFAGGASVSLGLLNSDLVDKAVLADLDPLVAAFWQECGEYPQRLIDDMNDESVTLERWIYWREYQPTNRRELALKCLFLNRTSFSGIMNGSAGPIGGRSQTSQYQIDCRFNKSSLARRIERFGQLYAAGRVEVMHQSWDKTLMELDYEPTAMLVYADPPYIEKAKKLYVPEFTRADHQKMASTLLNCTNLRWIVSYDNEPLALSLYQHQFSVLTYRVEHTYTMKGTERRGPMPGREILFTNLPIGSEYAYLEENRRS
jgi:DNA adenine methylase